MKKERETGYELLQNPRKNKGTGFTDEERDNLGLRGLLPPRVFSQDEQLHRVMENFRKKTSDLEKYIYMIALQDRNENLFYRAVIDNLNEMMPIIYTPTVGTACLEFGQIYRRSRGLFLSIKDKGNVAKILENWPEDDVRIIVVTDGERILGLGDLGASGMGIPIGKLSLYTALAGIDPAWCLPITLDVGTNNERLLNDPLYIGIQEKRITGPHFDEFFHEFVEAVSKRYPNVCIQLEDFGNSNAFRLLEKYRHDYCTFDDDIQGTAAVALAGLHTAVKLNNQTLMGQRILFLGAGEAGIGIGDLFTAALVAEGHNEEEVRSKCWYFDSKGLVVKSRKDLVSHKLHFAHDYEFITDFKEAVEKLKPTVIIGVSGQPQTFTKSVIETMAKLNEHPIIFALSNPTSKAECTAEQAYMWSEGRAIFASGSPFEALIVNDRRIVPGQGNNAYIFPGVGLGVILSGAKIVTDEMFYVSARELANHVTDVDIFKGRIYPSLKRIREVSAYIAAAVMKVAFDRGIATVNRPDDLLAYVKSHMYEPSYKSYQTAESK